MTSLKEKLYQMFMLGFEGDKPTNSLLSLLSEGLGGVIFFSQNIISFEQTKMLIEKIKNRSKYPPFLSIDQEGGRVERTENLFGGKKFLSANLAKQKGEAFVIHQTQEIADLLKTLGFNLNFAPVLDVNTNPDNPIIGERSFSSKTDEVIKFGKLVVETYLSNGIIPCTKHFPGHGNANADSHLTLPIIDLLFDDYEFNHIRAFKEVPSPMIMVAHLFCKAFDKEIIPSSVSKNVLGYLKNIAPNSIIITDDMQMNAIREFKNPVDNITNAILNGVNMILYRSSGIDIVNIMDQITEIALQNEEIQYNISISYDKILNLKKKYLL